MAEVTGVTIWGHIKILPGYVPSHMRTFLFGCHISFYWFFALEVMRGHEFWTHLQTCLELVDLLPPILESGTVSG